MGLTSVLVDRARLIRKAATPLKVGGRTTFVDVEPGEWFSCRLEMPTVAPESRPPSFASKRVVLSPTLIFDIEDDEGTEVVVRADDMLTVESEDLGSATWQVTGQPMPFRKKEGIIGWQVGVKRIDVDDFQPKVA